MVDTAIFYHLLKALPFLQKIILVGDIYQLPSINPGFLLKDIILTNIFSVTILSKIFRQNHGSNIIRDALEVNQGNLPVLNTPDSSAIPVLAQNALHQIIDTYLEFLKNDGLKDLQLLVPIYRGLVGIDNLNIEIQKRLFQNQQSFLINNKIYYIGDRVLQIKNRAELNVLNGDIGYITKITKTSKNYRIEIDFESNIVEYDAQTFTNLTKLAYAISIHKSQGSEYKSVILLIFNQHKNLLERKLLYTAMTRAKEKLVIFCEPEALKTAVKNVFVKERKTNLQYLFRSIFL